MDLKRSIEDLRQNAAIILKMAAEVSQEEARRKPAPDSWSILEVINHLYDEEREDFRVGLDLALNRPAEAWPSIDPLGWVTSRRYNERDLQESLSNFETEREQSLAWLASLEAPDWSAAMTRARRQMTAGDILAAWVAHDLLHMRQMVELKWALTTEALQPYDVSYAGDWASP